MKLKFLYFFILSIAFSQSPCSEESRIYIENVFFEKSKPIYLEEMQKWIDDCNKALALSSNDSKSGRSAKSSYFDALDDTLTMIHNNVSNLLIRYDRMIDLKRNILKSRLQNNQMTFIYHKPSRNHNFYRFKGNDRVLMGKINSSLIKIFPDRTTRGNGEQFILIEKVEGDRNIYGFINYKDIRKELPIKFREIVETTAFRDFKENKLLLESIENINSDEMDRWLEVTSYLLDEEIKEKGAKKTDQRFRSNLLNWVVIGLFILNLL